MSDDNVIDLKSRRPAEPESVAVSAVTLHLRDPVAGWVYYDAPSRRVLLSTESDVDAHVTMSADQARELGLALVGAAALADNDFRRKVGGP